MITMQKHDWLVRFVLQLADRVYKESYSNREKLAFYKEVIYGELIGNKLDVAQVAKIDCSGYKLIVEYGSPDFIVNQSLAIAVKYQSTVCCQLELNYLKDYIKSNDLERGLLLNLNVHDLNKGIYIID